MLIMESEVETLTIKKEEITSEISVIILLYKNPNFRGFPKPFDLEIYGKKMWKYLELACSDYPIKATICTSEKDVLGLIKPMLSDSKYTLVLYSDTPLIKKGTIKEILAIARSRDINVMRLTRGFLFNTEYIKQADSIHGTIIEKLDEEDFLTVFDSKQFEFVSQIMKSRILDFHQRNGILIKDTNSTFIDADVIIESGVVIEPFNVLKEQTFIGKNTILQSGNIIINSIVKDNCNISHAHLENTKIESGQIVAPLEKRIG